ncbi:MAG: class I SAM-dependent methyltransferase [Calditrichota bacterium]
MTTGKKHNRMEQPNCLICGSGRITPYLTVPDRFNPKEKFQLVNCIGCGFVFLSPRPDEESIGAYYQSEAYQPHQEKASSFSEKIYRWVRNRNVRYKRRIIERIVEKGNLLDYGCGTGEFLLEMQKSGWQTIGYEPAEKAAKIAREYGLQMILNLSEIKSKLNVITMWHVLEHVHQANALLDNFHQMLAPDGILIIAVPNRLSFEAQMYRSNWVAWDAPRHLYHFTPADMARLLDKHSFQIVNYKMLYLDPWYNALLSSALKTAGKNSLIKIAALIKALFFGKLSMFFGMLDKKRASSVIYLAKPIS